MTQIIAHKCDVCGKTIPEPEYGQDGYLFISNVSQKWPVGGLVFDVCKACVLILHSAEMKGIIPLIDRNPLYAASGHKFVEDGDDEK